MKADIRYYVIEIMTLEETDALIETMRKIKVEIFIELLESDKFSYRYHTYENKKEFRKELLTTMKLPKKPWRKF